MDINFLNINHGYDGRLLFKDFNLKIETGEKILLHGDSGIGKSTLLKMILGFVVPDSGDILIDNEPINSEKIWEIRKKIAYIPQEPDIPDGKCRDFIDDVLTFSANKSIKNENLEEYRKQFSLPEKFWESEISDISGGEKSRLAIILSLILKRKLFLLDEATAALDINMKKQVIELFANNPLWTVIVVSHDDLWVNNENMRIIKLEKLSDRINNE